jgi:pseudomonalisin
MQLRRFDLSRLKMFGLALGLAIPGVYAATPTWVSTETKAFTEIGATMQGALADNDSVPVVVSLKLRNRPQLEEIAQEVASGAAAPLTHDEFMANYAPTETQAQTVASYLASMGFVNVSIDDNRLLVSATGTAALASAAFNTSLIHVAANGHSGIANVTDAQVPSQLAGIVLGVLGLQTLESPQITAVPAPVGGIHPDTAGPHGYDPTAFPLIYSANTLPTGYATNVGIVSEGSLTQVLADLQLFESNNGLPILSPAVVNVGTPSSDQTNNVEWDLDSQNIQAMAGGSLGSLTFYVSPSLTDSNLAAVYSKIVSVDTAKIINISLAECEASAKSDGSLATDDQTFLTAVAQGQTFSVATGDNGSRVCGAPNVEQYGTSISVSYPASSAYVVAVGGTSLLTNTDGTYASETAWLYSGGGVSAYEQPTQWAQGISSVPAFARAIPDVAMDADPNSGAYIAVNGVYPTPVPWGGTSLASPLFVGAWARIQTANSNAFGYPNPLIYAQSVPIVAFHDITSGNNDDYNAAPNWDYTTGWGSGIISTLSANLSALPSFPASVTDAGGGIACPSDLIQWSTVAGASSYQLWTKELKPAQNALFGLAWSGTGTSTRVTLNRGSEFAYKVKACTADGCSQLSSSQVYVTEGTCQ